MTMIVTLYGDMMLMFEREEQSLTNKKITILKNKTKKMLFSGMNLCDKDVTYYYYY